MARRLSKPWPMLTANDRVIEYAVLDKSVTYSGHSWLFVDGKELGPVPCLAICQRLDKKEISLQHCDKDWAPLGHGGFYASVADAKKRAERIYQGVSALWVDPHYTDEDVRKELKKQMHCSFCGKRQGEIKGMIGTRHLCSCYSCIDEFYQCIRKDS